MHTWETKRRTDFLGKEISSTRRCNRLYWRRNASYLRREDIQMICETIFEHFHICEDAEITIEANPGTVDLKNYVHIGKMGSTGLVLACSQQ